MTVSSVGARFQRLKSSLLVHLTTDDERESRRQARLLRTILKASLFATGVAIVIPVFLTRPIPVPTLLIIGLAFIVQLATLSLVRGGRPKMASLLISIIGWALITLTAYLFGGLDDPSYNAYIIVVLMAGLLLGGRAATAFAGLSVVTGLALLLAGQQGLLPIPERLVTPAQRWAVGTVILFLSAVLLRLALGSLANALEEARRNERAQLLANQELLEIRNSLEQRVQSRTRELSESHSQLEAAYQALKDNHHRLLIAEKMASLGRLTAGIAHEMNTPLAAVRAALNQMETLTTEYQGSIADSGVTPEDHFEIAAEMLSALEVAQRAAERTASFVRGVKAQTRAVAQDGVEQFDAVEVIESSLVLLSHALREAGCQAQFDPPDEAVELVGSPGRFSQVITNLVTNAIDASRAKGAGEIRISIERLPEQITVTVEDQGAGIRDENLPRVFDPMFTTKPFGEGTGLGLTIVHDIVNGEFGGQIDISSQVGRGTLITLSLPHRQEVPSGA